MECRRNQGALILSVLKNTVLIREIRVKYFSFSVLSFSLLQLSSAFSLLLNISHGPKYDDSI